MQSRTSKLDYELLISLCNIVFNLVHFAMLHLISFTLQSLESIYNYLHILVQFTNVVFPDVCLKCAVIQR